jgi:hypothetical protein
MITEALLNLAASLLESLMSVVPTVPEIPLTPGAQEWLARVNSVMPLSEVLTVLGWAASVAVAAGAAWLAVFVARMVRGA